MKPTAHTHLKFKICISGAAETSHCSEKTLELTKELGKEVAEHKCVLVTGATTGAPYWAAIGAKEADGFVIGISPAATETEHVEKYDLPLDYHDLIIYTGFGYSGRNLLLTRSADAIILTCGRIGTLNEFTDAFEDNKPIGILEDTGGVADEIRGIVEVAHRGSGKIVYDSDPKALVEKVIALVRKEKVMEI
ncbi:MAG: LOG family protein [Candidatus Sungbacteria bacterium]|uniref:LOG family protein n=1 Tax=Candidatus Sungiibacteriota bacterium TaxID=2750080 RepID=A0A931WPG1_9BACT|nr:LOG family protein [Candidatus Sungbacteria bacterium]